MKIFFTLALIGLLFVSASANAIVPTTLTVTTDKPVYQRNEVVYVHINAFGEDGERVSTLLHVVVTTPTGTEETWMSTWPPDCGMPSCDGYLVYYFKRAGAYTITAETLDVSLSASTQITIVR